MGQTDRSASETQTAPVGMRNAWVLDLRSQPPAVVGHVDADNDATFVKAARVLAAAFSEPHYTIVQEVAVDV